MSIQNIIEKSIHQAHKDFSENPFDWTVYEIEGHFRLYEILKSNINNKMIINRTEPIPVYNNMIVDRVRIEYPVKDRNGYDRKPDICIFKKTQRK